MKVGFAICAVLISISGTSGFAGDLDQLDWLVGNWQSQQGASWSEEHWLPARERAMLGLNRSGSGKGKSAFEFLRIAVAEDGTPVYWAAPGGRDAVPFRLDTLQGQRASFINPAHDFPQRITYERDGQRLQATISALDGSGAMSFSWELTE